MQDQAKEMKSWHSSVSRIGDDGMDRLIDDEVYHIDFLHRYNIMASRVLALRHMRGKYSERLLIDTNLSARVSEDLSLYTNSLRDYCFFRNEGRDLFSTRGKLGLIVSNIIELEAAEKNLAEVPDDQARDEAAVAAAAANIMNLESRIDREFMSVMRETTSGFSRQKKHKMKQALAGRILAGLVGGLALVGPMLIMVLHPTKRTAILTTSCCVVVVAVGLGFFMNDSQPKDVVACTAAYAAVLIVFVGAAMGPNAYRE